MIGDTRLNAILQRNRLTAMYVQYSTGTGTGSSVLSTVYRLVYSACHAYARTLLTYYYAQ